MKASRDDLFYSDKRNIQLSSERDYIYYHALFIELRLCPLTCSQQFGPAVKTNKQSTVLNRTSSMGAPYNRTIIPRSIHDERDGTH